MVPARRIDVLTCWWAMGNQRPTPVEGAGTPRRGGLIRSRPPHSNKTMPCCSPGNQYEKPCCYPRRSSPRHPGSWPLSDLDPYETPQARHPFRKYPSGTTHVAGFEIGSRCRRTGGGCFSSLGSAAGLVTESFPCVEPGVEVGDGQCFSIVGPDSVSQMSRTSSGAAPHRISVFSSSLWAAVDCWTRAVAWARSMGWAKVCPSLPVAIHHAWPVRSRLR